MEKVNQKDDSLDDFLFKNFGKTNYKDFPQVNRIILTRSHSQAAVIKGYKSFMKDW